MRRACRTGNGHPSSLHSHSRQDEPRLLPDPKKSAPTPKVAGYEIEVMSLCHDKRRHAVPPRLRHGARSHRRKTTRSAYRSGLDQGQESGRAGSDKGDRRRMLVVVA